MSDTVLFRPLAVWPHKATNAWSRSTWPSSRSLTVSKALDHLRQQLRLLGCTRTSFIEVDLDEKHIRQDGQLRADASPRSPGCIVYATHPKLGGLRWACDQYKKLQDNIRAISMTIQSLRAVDRYGCVRDAEQFRGFKALPARASQTLSLDAALSVLAKYGPPLDAQTASKDAFARAVRSAQAATHPDRHEQDRALWDEVERAVVVLAPVKWRES